MDTVATSILAITCVIGGILKPEISGTWSLDVERAGGTNGVTCAFVRAGERLSGTCGIGEDLYALTGLAKGRALSWQVEALSGVEQTAMNCSGEMHEWAARVVGTCRVGDEFGIFTMEQRSRAAGQD